MIFEGKLWYSEKRRQVQESIAVTPPLGWQFAWHGYMPTFGRLVDGTVVQYTQVTQYDEPPPNWPDAVCLGDGQFWAWGWQRLAEVTADPSTGGL